ncbi:hypothetical protein H4R24_003870 [Coemansia sp. RSA 988]|nr:hypothetical protein H4R24_003870 [Coemansia sp. RSA 988]
MADHALSLHATDQNVEHIGLPLVCNDANGCRPAVAAFPMTPSSTQCGSNRNSPQLAASLSVAHINGAQPPSENILDVQSSSESFYSSNTLSDSGTAYEITPETGIMEKNVRQFCSSDGTNFIEHVPGHCLVFIPNSMNVDSVLREIRKIRRPKPRAKPKEKSLKPTNAFIKYRNHKILELKGFQPEISQTEISRMAGEGWRNEPDEVKMYFRNMYVEEKRIYDMNKAKRARTESDAGSDSGAMSDTSSRFSPHNMSLPNHPPSSQISNNLDLGLTLGLGANPAGFLPGRRRSHTLPPGGFARSGAKRRISQELRKHLANKSSSAYLAASNANPLDAASNGMLNPFQQQQQQQYSFDFSFTSPHLDSSAAAPSPQAGVANNASYMNGEVSAFTMPLNPSFPIADFTTPAPSQQHHSHHTRSLTSISNPLSIDSTAYSSCGESIDAFTSAGGLNNSNDITSVPSPLPLLNTSNLDAFAGNMPVSGFSSGYMSADAPTLVNAANSWPLQQSYTLFPDVSGNSAASTQ